MNINDAFPSSYLKSEDIKAAGQVNAQIATVVMEDLDGESKPIMKFHGKDKGMVINKTNAAMLAHLFGPETSAWAGQWVQLYVEPVNFQGRIVDGLRVRKAPDPAPTPTQPAAAPQSASQELTGARPMPPASDFDDDVPF